MDTKTMINQLKYEAEKHKNDSLFTGQTNITALCSDVIPKLEKLAEYETAEDKGRLLILPCKAGDTVYHVGSYSGITKHTIRELIVDTEGAYACSLCKFPISQFGVSVFLTYEEAEKALGELREK